MIAKLASDGTATLTFAPVAAPLKVNDVVVLASKEFVPPMPAVAPPVIAPSGVALTTPPAAFKSCNLKAESVPFELFPLQLLSFAAI